MTFESATSQDVTSLNIVDGLYHIKPLLHLGFFSEQLHPDLDLGLLNRLYPREEGSRFNLEDLSCVGYASRRRQPIPIVDHVIITEQLTT